MMHRKGDQRNLALTGVGVLLVLAGIALKVFVGHTSDTFALGCILVGGVMIRGESIVDLVRAFRKSGQPPQAGDAES